MADRLERRQELLLPELLSGLSFLDNLPDAQIIWKIWIMKKQKMPIFRQLKFHQKKKNHMKS